MVSLVESIEVPFSLISIVVVPDVEPAVVNVALTSVNVKAYGVLNVALPVQVVKAVVSSLQAIMKH